MPDSNYAFNLSMISKVKLDNISLPQIALVYDVYCHMDQTLYWACFYFGQLNFGSRIRKNSFLTTFEYFTWIVGTEFWFFDDRRTFIRRLLLGQVFSHFRNWQQLVVKMGVLCWWHIGEWRGKFYVSLQVQLFVRGYRHHSKGYLWPDFR